MRKLTILVICALLGIGISYKIFFVKADIIEQYSSYIAYPVLKLQQSIMHPIKSYFERKTSIADLHDEISQLKQDRDTLLAQNIELNALIDYAQQTQELTDFKKQYSSEHCTLAQVLAKNFSEQSHFFLVDKGSHAGVEPDMIALCNDCLIGKVIEVYPYYSKILLITDRNCKIAVYCTQSKATGIYQGCNQEWCAQLNHVSHLSQLETDELVLSSGDGLIFPRGFGVGKIKSFTTDKLFHQVQLDLLIDLRSINYCFLMKKGAYVPELAEVAINLDEEI